MVGHIISYSMPITPIITPTITPIITPIITPTITQDYVRCHPDKALFLRRHPDRETVEQEVNELRVIKKLQPRPPLDKWDAHLRSRGLYARINQVPVPVTEPNRTEPNRTKPT